jgi:hypothetical protein
MQPKAATVKYGFIDISKNKLTFIIIILYGTEEHRETVMSSLGPFSGATKVSHFGAIKAARTRLNGRKAYSCSLPSNQRGYSLWLLRCP